MTHPQTPMMQQYTSVKQTYPDYILLYRMGDFYELFFQDAILSAPILEITLTKRGKNEGEDIPMCGIPVHAYEMYVERLMKKGHKVAVCDQLETPEDAKRRGHKGPLKRDVVRILTPGTLLEEKWLPSRGFNFLLTLSPIYKGSLGVCKIDLSTGLFEVETVLISDLFDTLKRYNPAEILIPDTFLSEDFFAPLYAVWKKIITPLPKPKWDVENAHRRLLSFFKIQTLEIFGDFSTSEIQSSGVALDYIEMTQKGNLPFLSPPKQFQGRNTLFMDAATQKHLDIFGSNSLRSCLDKTITSPGSRMLWERLSRPLLDVEKINTRLDDIQSFLENPSLLSSWREHLKKCPDLERVLVRLKTLRGTPRDIGWVRSFLQTVDDLSMSLTFPIPPQGAYLKDLYTPFQSILTLLTERFEDDPLATTFAEGGWIRPNLYPDLDEKRIHRDQGQQILLDLEKKYREETGITTLKIRFNHILGHHIEVSTGQKGRIPDTFIHRQTLSTCGRYTTVELNESARRLESAAGEALSLEKEIFERTVQEILIHEEALRHLVHRVAEIDVTMALAVIAKDHDYCRPTLHEDTRLHIIKGRHPVIEHLSDFTPNDVHFNDATRFYFMTGPNMAGKSTFLRQNALIPLMAQMGSYVPAEAAEIGVVDRIFSRIGASDDLASGHSTFMVEMIETSTILHQATERSLVLLDEVGRGTSTYDGLAIAWAVSEALYHTNKCRTLFATHYHELRELSETLPHSQGMTMAIQEWNNTIVFLHRVERGFADRSYGIHVAAMAGFPKSVLERAQQVLDKFQI